jgi:phosphoglucomutase
VALSSVSSVPVPGKPVDPKNLVNIPQLITAYYALQPDPKQRSQRVAFGTSGHRGSSLQVAFNEWHIQAITQAICEYRKANNINGPLFIGIDTHALSEPAYASALEVLAGNGVEVMIAQHTSYTPTPVVSHAILTYNNGRTSGLADGIVITPSHNPPEDGGFKYDPPHGGPADSKITGWIEARANELLATMPANIQRMPFARALKAATTHQHDYLNTYVNDLGAILDMPAIRAAGLKLGVDPLGGAGIAYWPVIAERYGLNLKVVNELVDPTFGFMTADWDGRIRMDPSSSFAMQRLIALKDQFDIAFACDADHDRHGIVTKNAGLLPPNHYLAVCVNYLFVNRKNWKKGAAVGKTVVSSSMIDRVAAGAGLRLYEVPVGFKWFVDGLLWGDLGFGGEESAGASFLRRDGSVWTTDKDGIVATLLAAEITAHEKRDPGQIYEELTKQYGNPVYERIDAAATVEEKAILGKLSAQDIQVSEFAGEKVENILTKAPGNDSAIGGIKVVTNNGWFAARPSGTEQIYKIYAESFLSAEHLKEIQNEAKAVVAQAFQNSATTVV